MKRNTTKKGFTLIELLAVIVILAIIALIAVPVILNIIDKANKSAFKDSAYGIISAGELYFAEQQLDLNGMTSDVTIELPDSRLELKGNVPSGTVTITKDGDVSISVSDGRYCATKGLEDKDVTITKGTCGGNSNEGSTNTGLPVIWNAGSSVTGLVSAVDGSNNVIAYKISDYAGNINSLEGVDATTLINGVEQNIPLSIDNGMLKKLTENAYSIYDSIFVCTTSECNLGTFTLPEAGTYMLAQLTSLVSFSIGKPKETELVENGIMKSTNNCIKTGVCNAGTEVKVAVNDTKTYDFYVIKDTGSELTLIMNKNIGTQVAWASKDNYISAGGNETDYGYFGNNNKGPITALNYLNTQTSTWSNIPAISSYIFDNNLNGTTNEHGYQKLAITNGAGVLTSQDGTTTNLTGIMRARLLTREELDNLRALNINISPLWLHLNLSSSNTSNTPYGYWLLTTIFSTTHQVEQVYNDGDYLSGYVNDDINYGVRPVITISK